MVKLSLVSTKGNGARYFPHAGYLALTPLKVEGIVRTRLDDDRKPLQASDISVAIRCYEARISAKGVTQPNLLVDHQICLWSKPADEPWAEISEGDWPFKLVLPPRLAGQSTANFQEYRVFWRVEAVLNHVPMTGVGHRQVKTYDLPLIRYDPGTTLPPAPTVWAQTMPSKHAGVALRYLINTPSHPLGPLDLVPVSLKLATMDPVTRVHSIALAVERHLVFNEPPLGIKSPDIDDTTLSSTANLLDRVQPLPSPKSGSKVSTFLVTSADGITMRRDENGVYGKTATLQIPAQKSSSHWAVGETMRTALVTLRFFLRVKITLCTSQGADTVELPENELYIVSTNESQRRLASSKYTEAVERSRARDSSKQASRAESPLDGMIPATPMTASSVHGMGSPKGKGVRRPHTSAGPRDAARGASRRTSQNIRDTRPRARPHGTVQLVQASRSSSEREGGSEPEPGTCTDHVRAWEDELERIEARSHSRTMLEVPQGAGGSPSSSVRSAPAAKTCFGTSAVPQPSPAPSMHHLSPSIPRSMALREDSVQAWEEELERIAAQSRRRSIEMLGFNSERRTRPRIDVGAGGPASSY